MGVMTVIRLLVTLVTGAELLSAQCTSPYTLPKFQSAIAASKLQAPTSSQAASAQDLINGYCSNWFELLDTDKMAFYQTGALMRSELRYLDNWNIVIDNPTAHANVRIISQTCDQVTILQIHDDANAGLGPNKPLLRVYRHLAKTPTDHIWAAIKTDSGGSNTTHVDLGPTPSGYFDCDVTLSGGTMEIAINGTTLDTRDVSYWTFPSYWKAGAYLQDTGEATVYFNELTWSDEITNTAPTFTSDPINKIEANVNAAYDGTIAGDAFDVDSDPMTFSKVSGPAWLRVAANGTLSGTPSSGDIGDHAFTVQVDTSDGSDIATLNLTVYPAGVFWEELTNDDFESGWGNWTDGGDDARISSSFTIDTQSLALQDDSTSSVATLTNSLDLSAYSQLQIDFTYVIQSFEGSESFWVEYSDDGGSNWSTIEEYVNDVDFVDDGTRYNPSLTIDDITYNFTSTVKVRFRCDASANSDDVYFDEVVIFGFVKLPTNQEVVIANLSSHDGAFPGESDPNIIGFDADPDHDGNMNIFEVWRGSEPSAADQAMPLTLENFFISSTNRGSFIIETDSAMDDALVIEVQASHDLVNWRYITSNRQVLGGFDGSRTLRFYDSIALPSDSPFFVRFSSDPTAAPQAYRSINEF
ncbi:polysaccharide lyase family 7 protein [Akkermansiaceae bacterium]|nr:polysaccharide lyase family 7 protein [Akkermansiaceae bacterium]